MPSNNEQGTCSGSSVVGAWEEIDNLGKTYFPREGIHEGWRVVQVAMVVWNAAYMAKGSKNLSLCRNRANYGIIHA